MADAHDADSEFVYRDARWTVAHGPADSTSPGGLLIRSVRHFTDFAEMTPAEQVSFGPLIAALSAAVQATVEAERVHLVSTRDRVAHFHAWLYPRAADNPLRGTAFLAAHQRGAVDAVARATAAIRERLGSGPLPDVAAPGATAPEP